MSAQPTSLVEQLVARTGLAAIIASGVVRRACAKIGIDPQHMTARDLPKVVAAIEPLLALYLPGPEAAARAVELRRFAGI